MRIGGIRRTGLTLVGLGAIAAAAPSVVTGQAGAAPRVPAAKVNFSEVVGLSVAPHSKTLWALGTEASSTKPQHNYLTRRAGGQWKRFAIKGTAGTTLYSVAAGSPKAVWAVGSTYVDDFSTAPFAVHLVGGVFKPMKIPASTSLQSVSATSATNAWTVGGGDVPEVFHWDGQVWQSIDDSAQHGYGGQAIVSTASNNAWILANKSVGGGGKYSIARWNGHSITTSATLSGHRLAISGLAASGPKSAWVVGWQHDGARLVPYTAHFNGKSWKQVKSPRPSYSTTFTAVSMAGKKLYALANGTTKNPVNNTGTQYIFRFSGGKWHTITIPGRPATARYFTLVVSPKLSVAGGSYTAGNQERTLALTLKGNRGTALSIPR